MVVAKQAKKQSKRAGRDAARSMADRRDEPTQGQKADNRIMERPASSGRGNSPFT
jgi:hypothetical protein